MEFRVALGNVPPWNPPLSSVLYRFDYRHLPLSGHLVPTAGRERFRFNVWLNKATPLGTGLTEVIISDFSFIPLAERYR